MELSQIETLKKKGNQHMAEKKYLKAIECYTQGLEFEIDCTLLSNRAEAFLKLGYFYSAIEDCQTAINISPNEKTLYRKARALEGLADFWNKAYLQDAKEIYEQLKNHFIEKDQAVYEEIVSRIKTCAHKLDNFEGIFSMSEMTSEEDSFLSLISSQGYSLDSLPKENKTSVYFSSKMEMTFDTVNGNRWKCSQKIHSGELLLVERPIAYLMAKELEIFSHQFEQFTSMGFSNTDIPYEVMFTLLKDRLNFQEEKENLVKTLSKFCSSSNSNIPIDERMNNFKYEDDILREIISSNSILSLRNFTKCSYEEICFGLWEKAAFINHSCLPNSFYFGISNLLIVKAIKDIEVGDDITISYIEPKPLLQRNSSLSRWNFTCNCALCLDEKEICQSESYLTVYEEYAFIQNEMTCLDVYSLADLRKAFSPNDDQSKELIEKLHRKIDQVMSSDILIYNSKLNFMNYLYLSLNAIVFSHIGWKNYSEFLFDKAYDCIKDLSSRESHDLLVKYREYSFDNLFHLKRIDIDRRINELFQLLYNI